MHVSGQALCHQVGTVVGSRTKLNHNLAASHELAQLKEAPLDVSRTLTRLEILRKLNEVPPASGTTRVDGILSLLYWWLVERNTNGSEATKHVPAVVATAKAKGGLTAVTTEALVEKGVPRRVIPALLEFTTKLATCATEADIRSHAEASQR